MRSRAIPISALLVAITAVACANVLGGTFDKVLCTDAGPCSGATPVCDPTTSTCVQCTAGDTSQCDDANPCTSAACGDGGACVNTPLPDGTTCTSGATPGTCTSGTCSP